MFVFLCAFFVYLRVFEKKRVKRSIIMSSSCAEEFANLSFKNDIFRLKILIHVTIKRMPSSKRNQRYAQSNATTCPYQTVLYSFRNSFLCSSSAKHD